jgi:hypothetical protein
VISDERNKPPGHGDRHEPSSPRLCSVPDCGRPAKARGLCQTHYRQMLTECRVRPVHRYRKRTPGTVKFAGLRLSPGCARKLKKWADDQGLSVGAIIADILEDWFGEGTPPG